MRQLACAALLFALAQAASASEAKPGATCGADALGTSRVLAVGTKGGVAVGLKSYPRTLPLADHEVVLTFDDGPAPTTPAVLDALKAQCVKATFFLVGRRAEAMPDVVKRALAEGHTLGHHTYTHPERTLRRMSTQAAEADIDRGFAADDIAAYGASGATPRIPFFRFPGFADTPSLDAWLAARNVAVFGTDIWAMDWLDVSSRAELDYLMRQLKQAKRGIILLHDTRAQTAAMLPDFLRLLKSKGYRIVHIVPGPGDPQTATAPKGWASETDRVIAEVFHLEDERQVLRLVHRRRFARRNNELAWRRGPHQHVLAIHRKYGAAKRTRTSTGLPTSTSS